jgi:hypothetical protein
MQEQGQPPWRSSGSCELPAAADAVVALAAVLVLGLESALLGLPLLRRDCLQG